MCLSKVLNCEKSLDLKVKLMYHIMAMPHKAHLTALRVLPY